jgi:MYXO-CTERM domain-containing protein
MSRLTRSVFAIALSSFLVAGSARASQVVFGNLGPSGADPLSIGLSATSATDWYGHRFTLSNSVTFTNLVSATLGLGATVPPGGSVANVSALVYTNSGLSPGSLLFTSLSQTVSSKGLYTFTFNGASLTPGGSYWLVLATPGLDWFNVDADEAPVEINSSGYNYVTTRRTQNGGSSWSAYALAGGALSVSIVASDSATPIPEPGTWAAAALLIGAAAYVRWRRRPQAA